MVRIDEERIKRIILIRPDMIGDTILITPAISLIRERYPKAHIALLIRSYTQDLFRYHPDIDEIIIDQIAEGKINNIFDFLQYAADLRKKQFDLAIAFYNELPYALLCWLVKIPFRIGDHSKILFGWMYNVKVYQKWSDLTLHEVEHNLELLAPLGIKTNSPPPLKVGKSDRFVDTPRADFLVGIHPGTGKGNKAWLPERYAEVIDYLSDNLKAKVILLGGTKESEIGNKIIENCKTNPINMIDKPLSQTAAIISRLTLFIGVDSGPLHIAAAMKIPTVAIFPTKFVKPIQWGPWQTQNIIVRKTVDCERKCLPRRCPFDDCLKQIKAEDVIQAINSLLRGEGKWSYPETKLAWLKKSINILTNDLRIASELKQIGYHTVFLQNPIGFLGFLKTIIKNDINIIHWTRKRKPAGLFWAKIFSALFVAIPPLLISDPAPKSCKELISLYTERFKKRRYL